VKRIAVYPGSFDPLHNGHVDIVHRAMNLFDEVVVALLRNTDKVPTFSLEERVEMIRETFKGEKRVRVDAFDGLLVNYAESRNAATIIRGLRAISDFEYEFQMALMNRRLSPEIETVFLMPRGKYIYLSSRVLLEVARLGGDVTTLVPSPVAGRLTGL
jgi:pantetheine-phosphate adenylyltransferase